MSGSHYAPPPAPDARYNRDAMTAAAAAFNRAAAAPPDESTRYSLPPVLRGAAHPEHVLSGALPPQPEPDARTYDQRTDDRLRTLEAQMHGLRNHIALLVDRLNRLEARQ